MGQATHVSTEVEDGVLVARITSPTVSEYEAGVIQHQLVEDGPRTGWKMVIDVSEVMHMSSAGLGMLVTVHQRAKAVKGKVALAGAGDAMRELLRLTKLGKLFALVDDVEKGKKKVR